MKLRSVFTGEKLGMKASEGMTLQAQTVFGNLSNNEDRSMPGEWAISRRAILSGATMATALGFIPMSRRARAQSNAGGTADEVAFTRDLARFIATTPGDAIPDVYLQYAKIILLDTVGVGVAAMPTPLVTKLIAFADAMGGKEQSSLLAGKKKRSAVQAALINGSAMHTYDFDDTSSRFWGHASASIVPSLLALAELNGGSGRDVLNAYLIGLQASFVVADSVGEAMYDAGIHNTSALGIIASGAACARLLRLDEEGTVRSLAASATQSFGLKRSFGTMCKPFHAGHAAEGAVTSALLARDGFTGASDIFEGPNGLFAVYGGTPDLMSLAALGKEWGVSNVLQKAHAACQWTHSPINAAMDLQKAKDIAYQDIESIDIITSEIALKTADVRVPQTGLQAKFSIPYGVANGLVTGETGLIGYTDDSVKNQDAIALIDKITARTHPKAEKFQAKVTIKTKNGETYSEYADVFAEEPPLEERLATATDKFLDNAKPIIGDKTANAVADLIMRFEEVESAAQLFEVLNA
jgi:2-methylcitrate dehydratase PrpD